MNKLLKTLYIFIFLNKTNNISTIV